MQWKNNAFVADVTMQVRSGVNELTLSNLFVSYTNETRDFCMCEKCHADVRMQFPFLLCSF